MAPIQPQSLEAEQRPKEILRADKHRLLNKLAKLKQLKKNRSKQKEITVAQKRLHKMSVDAKPDEVRKVVARAGDMKLIQPRSDLSKLSILSGSGSIQQQQQKPAPFQGKKRLYLILIGSVVCVIVVCVMVVVILLMQRRRRHLYNNVM